MFLRMTRLLVVGALLSALGALVPGSASAAGRPVGPGTRVVTGGTVCSVGAVLRDARGRTLVAYPSRCAGGRAVGSRVRFTGEDGRALASGRLASVSGGLGLVRVDPRRTSAAVLGWGGPTGSAALPATGEQVFTLGHVSGALAPRTEVVHAGRRLAPSLPLDRSDTGAPVLDGLGRLVGLLVVGASGATVLPLPRRGLTVVSGGAFSPTAVG
jgi:hypothetical protein